jgi:hypothetical protein
LNDIYDFYFNYCPYVRRKLCTSKDLYEWYSKIDRYFFSNENDFTIFLNYLEKNDLISPLIKTSKISELYQSQFMEIYGDFKKEEVISYYHPIQFIEILTFIKHLNIRNSIFSLNLWCDPDFLKFYWEDNKNISLNSERIIKRMKEYPKIKAGSIIKRLNQVRWLKSSFLNLWIKLESIWLCKIFSPINIGMVWDGATGSSMSEFYGKIDLHKKWAEEEINKFTDEDYEMILYFHNSITYRSRLVEEFSDLNDLFYLISYKKKDKLSPLSLYMNILEISRELKKIYWILTKTSTIGKEMKPLFIFENEEEMLLFHNNVLLDYGLFATEPFIVFVEGGTECDILNAYKRRRAGYNNLGFVNIQGTGNLRDTIKNISSYFRNRLSFILLDYDNLEQYKERRKTLLNHGIDLIEDVYFFIPDFVTENFTVQQILDSYIKWLDNNKLSISNNDKSKLISQLEYAKEIGKQISKDPIKLINYINEIRFELILVNTSLRLFNKELEKIYPNIDFYKKEGQKKFSKKFKKDFCPFLTDIVIAWFRTDNRKVFSFETALWSLIFSH